MTLTDLRLRNASAVAGNVWSIAAELLLHGRSALPPARSIYRALPQRGLAFFSIVRPSPASERNAAEQQELWTNRLWRPCETRHSPAPTSRLAMRQHRHHLVPPGVAFEEAYE